MFPTHQEDPSLDAQRFDAITKAWTLLLRRRVVGGLAGSTLSMVATALGVVETGATHFTCLHVGKRCKNKSQCCSSRCKHGRCRAHNVGSCTAAKDRCVTGDYGCRDGDCLCYQTTGRASFCATGAGRCMACATDAECAAALNIPGSACVDLKHGICGGCANVPTFTTACVPPCAN